jgi:Uma2 family endonuclease
MPTLIHNLALEETLIARRRERGIDQFDEVWDGVYVMAPIANNDHQEIQSRLTAILSFLISFPQLGRVFAGANVSDQLDDWTQNYRVPDVLVYLNGNPAQDRGTHWLGGPDLAIEIVSQWDRSREKIDFYSRVGVRELLIIDRDPWQLELFGRAGDRLERVAVATELNGASIQSRVAKISLRLLAGDKRPAITVNCDDGRAWSV